MSDNNFSRRRFLGTTGGGLLFAGTVGGFANLLGGCETHGEIPRIAGQSRSFITPVDGGIANDFYVNFGYPSTSPDNFPQPTEDSWSLQIVGAVDDNLAVTFADIMAAAEAESVLFLKTMRCVLDAPGEPLISNGFWRGVPLKFFMEQAGVQDDALRVNITGDDGFSSNLRVARVMDDVSRDIDDDVPLLPIMLCYELNGAPIPAIHGGPVRLISPEKYGFKNMKWPVLADVTTRDDPFGYYETELFANDPLTDTGNIAVVSNFTGPVEGEAVAGPRVTFFGFALDGPGEIERVELSIDGGTFVEAELIPLADVLADPTLFFDGVDDANLDAKAQELDQLVQELAQVNDSSFNQLVPWVWTLWSLSVDLGSGSHRAEVRAFSTSGAEQPTTARVSADGNSQIRDIRFTVS